jgi:hypothetical protein
MAGKRKAEQRNQAEQNRQKGLQDRKNNGTDKTHAAAEFLNK